MSINNAQVIALVKAIGETKTVLVKGHMGSGKTDLAYTLFADKRYDGFKKTIIDCTTLYDGSVSMPDLNRATQTSTELPNERFGLSATNHRGIEGSVPSIIFLDEIGKVTQSVKDFLAPIIYERRIGELYFPEGSIIFAATNLDEEGLGDEIPAHFRNRVIIVNMRKPSVNEWLDWATNNGVNPFVISAVENTPLVFDETQKGNPYVYDADNPVVAFVTHRSLTTASMLMNTAGIDEETLHEALVGTVGAPFTTVLHTYREFGSKLPTVKQIIDGTAVAPEDQIMQLMVANIVSSHRIGPDETITGKDDVTKVLQFCADNFSAEVRLMLSNRLAKTKQIAQWVTHPVYKKLNKA